MPREGANDLEPGPEIRDYVTRFLELDGRKKELAEEQKEVMAEAKGRGYDVKVLRKLIAEAKRDPDDVQEELSILDLYREAFRGAGGLLNGDDADASALV